MDHGEAALQRFLVAERLAQPVETLQPVAAGRQQPGSRRRQPARQKAHAIPVAPDPAQAIGERAAKRYALTAERFDGKRARELGLLAECFPVAELDAQVEAWVANLLHNSPQAMRASKDLMREAGSASVSPALRRYTENAIARIRVSPEGQEGLNAFLEKRKPNWMQEPQQ